MGCIVGSYAHDKNNNDDVKPVINALKTNLDKLENDYQQAKNCVLPGGDCSSDRLSSLPSVYVCNYKDHPSDPEKWVLNLYEKNCEDLSNETIQAESGTSCHHQ